MPQVREEQQKQYLGDAIKILKKAIEEDNQFAEAYVEEEKYEKIKSAYQKALIYKPRYPKIQNELLPG